MIDNKRAKIMCIVHFLSEMIHKSGISDLTSFTIRTQYYLNLITFIIEFYAYFFTVVVAFQLTSLEVVNLNTFRSH